MSSNRSGKFLFTKHFSHIYVEEEALSFPMTEAIFKKFPMAERIPLKNYKTIFNRPNQNFPSQKRSMQLILAVKKDNFLYEGSDFSQNMGHMNFYYTTLILNCVYNCDYCYLQGMYPSANVVVFVNGQDFFQAALDKLKKEKVYLAISYDTDLLAFENVVPYCKDWIAFAREHESLTVEIRTKSANWRPLQTVAPVNNVILAWTLSPKAIADRYELGAAPLNQRLEAVSHALKKGWNVRLCFDPLILGDGWRTAWADLIRETSRTLPIAKVHDVSAGVFRMNADYLRRIRKQRTDSPLVHYPFEFKNGAASYSALETNEAGEFVLNLLSEYLPKDKIFIN
jgi:spore photoproduct lyase